MSELTPEQALAVNDFGHNILVSAGAGSGKTKVLTERVFKHILKDHIDIDRMLVLTFTNAAASEMKARIRKTLVEDKLLPVEERNKQLNKIDSSNIMTFDAYFLFLVKKYHQELGLDKDISIIDNNVLVEKGNEILDEIFEEYYKSNNQRFLNLIDHFCLRDDKDIKETIKAINSKLSQLANLDDFINNYEDNYLSNEALDRQIDIHFNSLKLKLAKIDNYFNELSNYTDDLKINELYPIFYGLKEASNYKEMRALAKDTSFTPYYKGIEWYQEYKDIAGDIKSKAKKLADEIKDGCEYDEETIKSHVLNTKDECLVILEIISKLNKRLDIFKKENNAYGYNDIMKLAVRLISENEEIRNEIKDSYKEILIDEYQDTSDLQDNLIKMIGNNNVYMVGDIKQSIYRFRNANPDIFKEKHDSYKDKKGGELIELTYNFRSRKEVLDSINIIFNRIMTYDLGGADYTKGHSMSAGLASYEEALKNDENHNLEVLSYEVTKEEPFNNLTKEEVEAFIVAKDIKDKIVKGCLVADKDHLRPCTYKDFSILISTGSAFDMFKQVLTYFDIPCQIVREEKISDSDLFVLIRNIYKLLALDLNDIDSYDFKYGFTSIARSFVGNVSDEELFEIVTNKTYKDSDIYKKLSSIKEDIEYKTISNILDEIIDKFDIYNNINKIGDVKDNLIKINYLYSLSYDLNNIGYSYIDFFNYLDSLDGKETDITFNVSGASKDAVTISTIHKSKGLEYPFVYMPMLFKKFNTDDIKKKITYSKSQGIILPEYIENRGLKSTILLDNYKYDYYKEEISERIRLFYVALTRAREKLILIAPLEDNTKEGKIISSEDVLQVRRFNDLLGIIYSDLANNNLIKEINPMDYNPTIAYRSKEIDLFNSIKIDKEKINIKELKEIKPKLIETSHFSKDSGLISKETIKKMEYGTKIHYFLEVLDFNNPNFELVDKEFVSNIKNFLASDIMKDKDKAKIYKEYEFITTIDTEEKHGIIDLLMEYDDHFDIIDYKTKNIDDLHYDEQLNGYRDYIKSISGKKVNCYLYSIIDGTYRIVSEPSVVDKISGVLKDKLPSDFDSKDINEIRAKAKYKL